MVFFVWLALLNQWTADHLAHFFSCTAECHYIKKKTTQQHSGEEIRYNRAPNRTPKSHLLYSMRHHTREAGENVVKDTMITVSPDSPSPQDDDQIQTSQDLPINYFIGLSPPVTGFSLSTLTVLLCNLTLLVIIVISCLASVNSLNRPAVSK